MLGAPGTGTLVSFSVAGTLLATRQLPASRVTELELELPAPLAGPRTIVEVRAVSGYFGSLHYWFEALPRP
jgi:hypothetical protein